MKKIKIVTFNLRTYFSEDGINNFIHRGAAILNKIKAELPHIICFQEAVAETAEFLTENLPEYQIILNRRNPDLTGEGLATAVLKSDFYILSNDFFWLSNTPRVPGSRFSEQSKCPRVTQCIIIQNKLNAELFRIYNVHLDHRSESAKILGIKCLMEYAIKQNEILPAPLFLLGDFNSLPGSETIKYCNNYKDIEICDLTAGIPFTFHGFGRLLPDDGKKIDYIYTNKEVSCKNYSSAIWSDEADGIYLSDHYPVCVTIEL